MTKLLISLSAFSLLFIISISDSYAGPPLPTTGACCTNYPSGECEVLSLGDCQSADGDGFFEGDTCTPNPCDDPPDSIGDCCVDHITEDTTGCDNSECEDTVCAVDGFCCIVNWDDKCASEAQELCGSLCSEPAGPVTIVPTMGQWGMILATIILGATGVFAIVRERNLNRYIK